MTSPELQKRPCVVTDCKAPRAKDSSRCVHHRRELKAATRKARVAERGADPVHNEDSTIRDLIAFPEPAKYLALLRDICRPRATDRRTIAGRQGHPEPQAIEIDTEDNPE